MLWFFNKQKYSTRLSRATHRAEFERFVLSVASFLHEGHVLLLQFYSCELGWEPRSALGSSFMNTGSAAVLEKFILS